MTIILLKNIFADKNKDKMLNIDKHQIDKLFYFANQHAASLLKNKDQ